MDEITLEVEMSWPETNRGPDVELAVLRTASALAFEMPPDRLQGSFQGMVLARGWRFSKTVKTFEKHYLEGFAANNGWVSGSIGYHYSESSWIRVGVCRRRPSWGVDEFSLDINWTFGDVFSPTEPDLPAVMFGAFSELATRYRAIWGTAEIAPLGRKQPRAAQPGSDQVAGVSEGQIMSVELFKQFPPSVVRYSETYETDQGQRVCCLLDLSADSGIATQLLQQFSAHHRPIE